MKPKLSVIMPAYNAEKYIEHCIRSLLDQGYEDLELLVVNDGSTDTTPKLVEAIAAEDSRVQLLTVPNAGPAMARNYGLNSISEDSEYVMFMDADDELLPGTLEAVIQAGEDGADLVLFGFTILSPNGSRRDYFEPDRIYSRTELGEALPRLYMANMLNQVWGKLFRADLIRSNFLRFQNYLWGEDRLFIFDCLERAQRVCVLSRCGYLYIMHPGESLISRYYSKKLEVCCLADERMSQLCERFGTQDDAPCRYMFVKSVFSCLTNLFSPSCELSPLGRREYMQQVLDNEQVQERSRGIYGGWSVKLMCFVMHTRIVWLNLLMFRTVVWAGKKLPGLFLALKHKK